MSAKISQQQRGLEKYQAGNPYRRRPAQQRQQTLACHRLYQKEEAAAQENGGNIKNDAWTHEQNQDNTKVKDCFLLAFAQLPAEYPKFLLLVGLQPTHHFSDPAGMLG